MAKLSERPNFKLPKGGLVMTQPNGFTFVDGYGTTPITEKTGPNRSIPDDATGNSGGIRGSTGDVGSR
jgi:hypothetical protein